jgi:phosphoglucosamine mutase
MVPIAVWAVVADIEATLGEGGRVLLRASGTEPLVRVMVETEDEQLARSTADQLGEAVAAAAGDIDTVAAPPTP